MKNKFLILILSLLLVFSFTSCTSNVTTNNEDTPKEDNPNVTTYTVTFNTNGGSAVESITTNSSGKITAPSNPTRDGYTFAGWYLDNSFKTSVDLSTYVFTANTTLYAKWTEVTTPDPTVTTYTVTFNTNGGSAVESLTTDDSGKITAPANPTKSGFEFGGWYSDEALTTKVNLSTYVFTSDTTLYANWVEDVIIYTVTFNTNGGSAVESLTTDGSGKITAPANPTKSGFEFGGWYGESTLITKVDIANYTFTEDTTLYAKWISTDAKLSTIIVNGNTINVNTTTDQYSYTEAFISSFTVEAVASSSKATISDIEDSYDISAGESKSITITVTAENGTIKEYTLTVLSSKDPSSTTISSLTSTNETIGFTWEDSGITNVKVEYKLTSEETYTEIDEELIRYTSSTKIVRADVIGLAAGTYDLKVTTNDSNVIYKNNIEVTAIDRSGYAHFNYTEGVGAYNDDGTLKDGAIVIYVTEENKDTITIPGYESCGTGIGWILNNAQYSKSGSNTYTTNADNLGIYPVTQDHPVVIRIIGTVTSPEGLTAYDSTDNGGTEGDNGHMARMKNAKNVTIEGVGTDATIEGWGIHFMCSDSTKGGYSFEVRNLTFTQYPEDALGMEGVQESGVLTQAVSRCFIHHNTFLPGYCANPAESDKAEGDGSCDFKRGQYYTLSYNYFYGCHKTNLIGSSDDSLQYNITMHHNWWDNCESRIPLVRQANVHYYNNYISVDTSGNPSYVISARASCYLFSEANYYEGCKNTVEYKSGGIVKSYNDVYYACYETNSATIVSSRNEEVSNTCKYSDFDTNSEIFYYDSTNKVSDCYLTSATVARSECIKYCGVLKDSYDNISTNINEYTPDSAVSFTTDSLTVSLSSVTKGSSVVDNVYFNNVTGLSSGTIKFKGQGITFKLTIPTEVTIIASASTTDYLAELVGSDGYVYASKFESVTITLNAGTYFIASGNMDKEVTISSLVFANTEIAKEARIEACSNAINNIPSTITFTDSCYNALKDALDCYNALSDDEKAEITNYSVIEEGFNTYYSLGVTETINLIDSIGDVDSTKESIIDAAYESYNKLDDTHKALVTNYDTLVSKNDEFNLIEINNLIESINNLSSIDIEITNKTLIDSTYEEYNELNDKYLALDSTKQALVTNYDTLSSGLEKLLYLKAPYEVKEILDSLGDTISKSDLSTVSSLKTQYEALDSTQLSIFTDEDITKYNSIITQYEALASQSVVHNFTESGIDSDFFTISGNLSSSKGTATYNGLTLTQCLKIESSTSITFTTTSTMTLTLVLGSTEGGKSIKIDGTVYTSDSSGVVTVELAAGEHTITKKDTANLFYISLD